MPHELIHPIVPRERDGDVVVRDDEQKRAFVTAEVCVLREIQSRKKMCVCRGAVADAHVIDAVARESAFDAKN